MSALTLTSVRRFIRDLQNADRRSLLLNHMRRSLVESKIKIVALLWPTPPQKSTKDSTGRFLSFGKPKPDEFDAVVHVNPTHSPEQLAAQIKSVMEKGQSKREEEARELEGKQWRRQIDARGVSALLERRFR